MSLCGWFQADSPGADASATLAAMVRALGVWRPDTARVATLGRAGAAGSWSLAEDGVIAAMAGRPRWTAPGLDALEPANALCEAWRRYGERLTDCLEGEFTLAVAEPAARRFVLAVDRMGIGRLCHALVPSEGVVFAATADSVLAHPALSAPALDHAALQSFLHLGVIPSPQTIWQGIGKLPPGHRLVGEGEAVRVEPYWRPRYDNLFDADESALAAELVTLLRRAVARAAEGADRGHLGTFLSGGLDSSTVTGFAQPLGEVTAFTIGFDDPVFDETPYAIQAARFFGVRHVHRALGADASLDILRRVSVAADEPFANSSVVPTHACAALAREHGVDVLLAGDGGDELFAGNARYAEDQLFSLYDHVPEALRPLAERLPGRLGRYSRKARLGPVGRLKAAGYWSHSRLSEALEGCAGQGPWAALRHVYDEAQATTPLQRRLALDLKLTLADDDLRKVRLGAALAGQTVRFPMLDDELVAFATRVPPRLLMPGTRLRRFYKRALTGLLPPSTLAKRKHGFGLPFAALLGRGRGLEMAMDTLAALGRRHILHPAFINRLRADLAAGADPAIPPVAWDLVVLELWLGRPVPAAIAAQAGETVTG